jgi:hypothetical protein
MTLFVFTNENCIFSLIHKKQKILFLEKRKNEKDGGVAERGCFESISTLVPGVRIPLFLLPNLL